MLPRHTANFGMDAEIGAMVPEGDPVTRMSGATFASVSETLRKHLENTFYADRKQTVYMLTERLRITTCEQSNTEGAGRISRLYDRKQTVYMLTQRIFQKHCVSKVIPNSQAVYSEKDRGEPCPQIDYLSAFITRRNASTATLTAPDVSSLMS